MKPSVLLARLGAAMVGVLLLACPSPAPAQDRAATAPAAEGQAAASRRLPPRPTLSEAEYADLAKKLREAYSQPREQWPKPTLDEGIEFRELGLVPKPVYPDDNPFSEAKNDLGMLLFFDPRLSGSGQISCASCHDAELGWGDGRTVSFGHARAALPRNAPTLLNVAARPHFFWDGRAGSLEEQALGPIGAIKEMNATEEVAVGHIAAIPEYRQLFKAAFGDEQVTLTRITQAIATFERGIVSRPSDFDRFLSGNHEVLSDAAVRGLHLFRTDARCINCHSGPLMTDDSFHNLGLHYYGRELQDLGRYEITGKAEDVGKFRTPTLRNLPRTGPYMHNGLFDLDGVVRMYNAGMSNPRPRADQMNDPLFPRQISPHLKSLGLNERDIQDLLAFLNSLEELRHRVRQPALPGLPGTASSTTRPSGLPR